jgi:ABC-type transporter Mla subunit MlaD
MEPEARYAWVGVSVLVLLTAMIGAILWLVASGGHGEERTYRIYSRASPWRACKYGATS